MAVRSYPDNVAEEAGVLLAMAFKKRNFEFKLGTHCALTIADYGVGLMPDGETQKLQAMDAMSDPEAVRALRMLAGEFDPIADYPEHTVGSLAIGDNLIKALLPLLAKWLLTWLQNGGLEEILKRLAPQA